MPNTVYIVLYVKPLVPLFSTSMPIVKPILQFLTSKPLESIILVQALG